MDYGRLFFDPPAAASRGNMFFLGHSNPSFRGPRTLLSMEENSARKRPFFTSPDELIYDEEYYDEQLPDKKRRLTSEQVHMLEKSFEEENKLEPERKTELAKKLGLQPRQVAVWFQNRRARSKNKQLEKDYDLLKASYDTLRTNYEAVLKDNEKLKSEVHSLTEKLQAKEVNGPGPISGPAQLLPDFSGAHISAQQQLSSGSTGASAVVNEENPQLVVDSTGDSSFFDCRSPPPPPPRIANVQPEEDTVSDDGRDYFPCMFTVAADHQEEEEGHDLGWWVWS